MEAYEKAAAGMIVAAMVVTAGLIAFVWANPNPIGDNGGVLSTFSRRSDLYSFMTDSEDFGGNYAGGVFIPASERYSFDTGSGAPQYSKTNVQVAGIDELDEVKTDGKSIFISSWNEISILSAYPPTQMEKIATINGSTILGELEGSVSVSFYGVFVVADKLVVVCTEDFQSWWGYPYQEVDVTTEFQYQPPRSMIMVFDISDPTQPTLDYLVGVTGYPYTARMIDNTVYLIAQYYPWVVDTDTMIPRIFVGASSYDFPLNKIQYDAGMKDAGSFMIMLAVDVVEESYDYTSIIAGWASTIYMSKSAIFLTVQKWSGAIILFDGQSIAEDSDSTLTTIFKVSFTGLSMRVTATGEVKGWLLNQFSMDEKEPYLRLATTNSWTEPTNSVYVLDSNLNVVGLLSGIAPTERIFSSRFVGDTLYLVTFRQIDPLFVIDLSDPTKPSIIGELEMPGFSSYLHPVDATHLLGVGRENSTVKVSLYDVSDPTNPVEQSKYLLEGFDYAWSTAEYDHKAVLFDLERHLLVIPITGYGMILNDTYLEYTYVAGALVLEVSVESGISFRGIIEHELGDGWSDEYVFRSLYIGDYLYTISSTIVKASLISDLSEINSLVYKDYGYPYYYVR